MSVSVITEPAPETLFERLAREARETLSERILGRVIAVQGLTVSAGAFPAPIGARCVIRARSGNVECEVAGLRGSATILVVFSESAGVSPGDPVECLTATPRVPVGWDLLGRMIDGQGRGIDGRDMPLLNLRYPLYANPPSAMQRRIIDEPLGLGVRAIDALLTAGRGQRLGIFAGTGVGKSVLMGMICRGTQAQVNVVALVGERGREVRDFVEQQLGPEGMKRSVIVVSTSDEAPALRVRACFHAIAIAEFFRDQGLDVLFMMDSLTRLAMAQRQLGLAAGEPPTAKGYPPSTFALLPRLLERAGRTQRGSITGVYTVLVEGDEIGEPLADAVRGILDGHIWLSRGLANRGHFPAIDVLQSVSRVADDVTPEPQRKASRLVRRVLATWNDIEDLVNIGAYAAGASTEYDVAVRTRSAVTSFLQQGRTELSPLAKSQQALQELVGVVEKTTQELTTRAAPAPPPAPSRRGG